MKQPNKIRWQNQLLTEAQSYKDRVGTKLYESPEVGLSWERLRDLPMGAQYSPTQTDFRVWTPGPEPVYLLLYEDDQPETPAKRIRMKQNEGFSFFQYPGDLKGWFYCYERGGMEVTDPYSIAASLNSKRTAIVDLTESDPPGFRAEHFQGRPADQAVIYETHVGDFTFSKTSGVSYRGKFLGLAEEATRYLEERTGLDHLKELGITHIHLMPVFDFISVDETPDHFGEEDNYNWGYDPELYNVPEGSYATQPKDPVNRIYELKKLIFALHKAGIGVILDVVYNHTWKSYNANFNILAPGYYYRSLSGVFSNGSGVGNELASERPMVRKFILDSLRYWQEEYQVDGFRFDLMALTDRTTIDTAIALLRSKNPNIIIYGEPWAGGYSALPLDWQVLWGSQRGKGFALFNEAFRTALRGDNDGVETGFLQGNPTASDQVADGLLGSPGLGIGPLETINYFNAHDNLILEDKLQISMGEGGDREAATRLAFGLLLTAQGMPFFHAGNEFRRDKKRTANAYHSPYSVNAIDWQRKWQHKELCQYVQDLILLRRTYPVLRLPTACAIQKRVRRLAEEDPHIISLLYQIEEGNQEDYLLIVHHNGWQASQMPLAPLFEALGCFRLTYQCLLDYRGKIVVNRTTIAKSDLKDLPLDPLSTTVFRIWKGAKYEL